MPSKKTFKPHPDYSEFAPQWRKCRITAKGEDAVKAAGQEYLPALEESVEDQFYETDYAAYKARASFYGAMDRTVQGLTGAVMRKAPTVQGRPWVKLTNPDQSLLLLPVGYGNDTLLDMIQATVKQVVEVGRCGHLIDAVPEAEARTSEEAEPYVVRYNTEDIITWHEETVRSRKRLVLVVLRESTLKPNLNSKEHLLEMEATEQFRVLSLRRGLEEFAPGDEELLLPDDLDNGAVYVQEIWQVFKDKNGKEELRRVSAVVPRARAGRPLDYIPFRFTNTDSVHPGVEEPPLVGLANVNLSHYRNSADLEHGRHFTALPTPWAAGFKLGGDKLRIGSRTAWVTEDAGGKADMLEFTGAGLGHIQEGMKHKEAQMAVLGARLLEAQRPGAEQPEAIRLRQTGDAATLSNIVDSVESTWTWILNHMWAWSQIVEQTEPFTVQLNSDFASAALSPQMITALTSALQTGSISWPTYVENLQRGEIIDSKVTPELEQERISMGIPSAALSDPTAGLPFGGAPGQGQEG